MRTKYFTSKISAPIAKRKRQNTFLEALMTLSDFDIFYGHYLDTDVTCPQCGHKHVKPSEKMTDVNIAIELLTDAFQDSFDTALLISADSDLIGPIVRTRTLFPKKKVIVGFPPNRHSTDMRGHASYSFPIRERRIAKSLFPPQVQKPDGYILQRPTSWQ